MFIHTVKVYFFKLINVETNKVRDIFVCRVIAVRQIANERFFRLLVFVSLRVIHGPILEFPCILHGNCYGMWYSPGRTYSCAIFRSVSWFGYIFLNHGRVELTEKKKALKIVMCQKHTHTLAIPIRDHKKYHFVFTCLEN